MNSRSSFSFSTQEALMAAAIATVGILGFYWRMQDPAYFIFVYTCAPLKLCCGDGLNCTIPERTQIFTIFFIPLGCILATGGVSMMRMIHNEVRDFSTLGHWAMAWPMLACSVLFIGSPMWMMFFRWMWPIPFIGLVLAIIASLKSIKEQQNYGDLSAFFLNVIAIALEYLFFTVWLEAAYIQ